MKDRRGTIQQRFEAKVFYGSPCGCHYWIGGVISSGYGMICFNNKMQLAHRVSYILNKGQIPDGMYVLHSCDNRLCVNPDHLWLGTCLENISDRNNKGRSAMGVGIFLSKLNDDKVREIRKRIALGEKQSELAKRFNVGEASVWCVVKNRTWKHVV